ncbi:MAG: hypothetical protein KF684_00015 [Phycisphaeraceae bacterium]|nr:hypothetical protein [Phycisphaeraceae bacterium]
MPQQKPTPNSRLGRAALAGLLLASCALAQPDAAQRDVVGALEREARAVRPLVETDLARAFLDAVADLPRPGPRVVYYNRRSRDAMTESDAQRRGKAEVEREGYERTELSDRFFYFTRYGSPIAYVRAIDLAARHGLASVSNTKIMDFGYGGIGHLRLLASLGAHAVGVDVDPLLHALYTTDPADTGASPRAKIAGEGPNGSVTIVHGRFPADRAAVEQVGAGCALILSKNTLKLGYIHPERDPPSQDMLISLGVDDESYLRAVRDALAPGGLFVIYNLYPKPSEPDEPYKPWADGRCPFPQAMLERVGFEVIEYNRDDTEAARAMGDKLGWRSQMDFETDLFGMFTIARKRE